MATACGESFTIIVTEKGDLWSCGRGEFGQLGLGSDACQQLPALIENTVDIFGNEAVVMVAAGRKHAACVTAKGTLWTWGGGAFGKLGHGDDMKRQRPTRLGKERYGRLPAIMVTCGNDHTLVLTAAGLVWSCGCGAYGRLGHGDEENKWALTLVVFEQFKGNRIVIVAAGGNHSVALGSEGMVWTWGWGRYGQLGHNEDKNRFVPTMLLFMQVKSSNKVDAVLVAAGMFHTVALTSTGDLWVWGRGHNGQLGLGNESDSLAPRLVTAQQWFGGSPILTVACGYMHTLAVTKNGTLWSFGIGSYGELGHNDVHSRLVPTRIAAKNFRNTKIVCVSAGFAHSAAVTEEGVLYTWGKGKSWNEGFEAEAESPGGLGHVDGLSKLVPTPIHPHLLQQARVGRCHELSLLHALASVMGNHVRLGRAQKIAGAEDGRRKSQCMQNKATSVADTGKDCEYVMMPGELVKRVVETCVSWPEGPAGELEGLVRLLGGGLLKAGGDSS
jgi:RCC1 and BTB domain-containing protein